jgi:hypothetical protein
MFDNGNETDVREEIAAPLLSALGYKRGTANDILRELSIKYGRNFLGRKKDNDPPLRGRADYVLSVAGAGRWVLEVKAPSSDITQDSIEQAISYARHPEVSGTYATILNGRRFVVVHNSQRSTDAPLLDLQINSLDHLVSNLKGLLSPAAIRRDCSPPAVDVGRVLTDGLRSSAQIIRGHLSYDAFEWKCSLPLPQEAREMLDEQTRKMTGFRADVIGGRIWRDDAGRIRAKLSWGAPHEAILQFAQDKNLMDAEFISLDEEISRDPNRPTVFDAIGNIHVEKGEAIFDLQRWEQYAVRNTLNMVYRGQALGYIDGNLFIGRFQTEYESIVPISSITMQIDIYALGTFQITIDPK